MRIQENWGDSVPDGQVTDFKRAVKAEADEVVDARWEEFGDMPFDGKRMMWAGFTPIFDSGE